MADITASKNAVLSRLSPLKRRNFALLMAGRTSSNMGRSMRVFARAWLVLEIIAVDEESRDVYFTGVGREPGRDPYRRHLYRVSLEGSEVELLSPEDAPEAHLEAMEVIFGHLSQETFRRFLRQAETVDAIVTLLDDADEHQLNA